MTPHTTAVTSTDTARFADEVLRSDKPVIVDFWAPWCGPCRALGPVLDATASALEGLVKVVKVNVDENPRLASEHGVSSIPTLIFFAEGEEQDRLIGLTTQDDLLHRARRMLD